MGWIQKVLGILPTATQAVQIPVGMMPVYPRSELNAFINAYSSNASLYTIVSMIARKFAAIPRYVYEIQDDTAETQYKRIIGQRSFKRKQAVDLHRKAYEETIVMDNDLAKLMMYPNEVQNQDSYYQLLATYYLLCGEGFEWLNRGLTPEQMDGMDDETIETMPIKERWCLPPQYVGMVVARDSGSVIGGEVTGYQIINNGKPINLRVSEVLHWKTPNPKFDWFDLSHFRGLSPLFAGMKILTQDGAATDASVAMYQNGGARGAIVQAPTATTMNLSAEQLKSIDDSIGNRVNGKWNKGMISRLPGPWTYLNFGQTSVEMELVDASDKIFVKLCNLYGVNPQVFMTATTFNNVEQARADLITNLVLPMCCSLRDEENEDFLEAFGMSQETPKPGAKKYTTDCDVSMLPELQTDMEKTYQSLASAWGLSLNERRMMMEQEELAGPEGNVIFIPNNLISLDDALMPPETTQNTPYGQGGANTSNNGNSLSNSNGTKPAQSSGSKVLSH